MKNQALFSSKNKSTKLKCRLQQFLFGALSVKIMASQTTDTSPLQTNFTPVFLQSAGPRSAIGRAPDS